MSRPTAAAWAFVALIAAFGCGDDDSGADAGPDAGPPPSDSEVDAGPDVPASNCPTACEGETPICDEDGTMECVQCLTATDCEGMGVNTMCNDAGSCVQCTDSTQCTEAGASECAMDGDMAGSCVGCTVGAEGACAGVEVDGTALNVCDDASGSGVCVECTEATAETDCALNSCNPRTNLCTDTPRGEVNVCGACVSDTECDMGMGFRCVPMNFQGTALEGGFCLKLVSETCDQPYETPLVATSLSDEPETSYCGINMTLTTCEAYVSMRQGTSCADDDGMPDPILCAANGARCEMVGVRMNTCTVSCAGALECPSSGVTSMCEDMFCGSM